MIEISPEIITIIMLGGVLVGLLVGYPLAPVLAGVALVVGYLTWGGPVTDLFYTRMYELIRSYVILAVPLFILMGIMLERSGIAEGLYKALYLWLGGIRGGLAISTVLIGVIVAATVGIIGASVTMLTLIALPAMLKRGYSKSLASGAVCAGGTLGILIPPSIMLVIYGPMAMISVGKLFMAAIMPGLVLAGLYTGYIALRCLVQPEMAPTVPPEERAVPFLKKTTMLLTSLVPPMVLIMAVLGSIFLGIAPPTEAASVGAFAAILMAIAYRKFNWQVLKEATLQTMRVSSMVLFIAVCGYMFTGVFLGLGGGDVVKDLVLASPGGRWGAFAAIMFIVFILGMFIDWIGIIFIMIPIITPIGAALGFDSLWFAMMIIVNLQMSFMTPPLAYAIFYVRGAADPEWGVTTADIIRGVLPFVGLIVIGLALLIIFPDIILWLPRQMIR
ncbi:MAG: TRAP transporter large permease subunit [Dehalococcoidales bacterium]